LFFIEKRGQQISPAHFSGEGNEFVALFFSWLTGANCVKFEENVGQSSAFSVFISHFSYFAANTTESKIETNIPHSFTRPCP